MTKNQYIKELEYYLKDKPKEERISATMFIEEYYDELGDGKLVIDALGTPFEFSQNIIKNTHFMSEKRKSKDSKSLWLIILAVLSAPISIPLVIVFLSLLFTGFVLLGTLMILALTAVIVSFAFLISTIKLIFTDIVLALYMLSLSFIIGGLSLLLLSIFYKAFHSLNQYAKLKLMKLKEKSV